MKKKSAWTKEEDAVLKEQVKVHGANWAAISEALPGRNRISCRNRWCQHLRLRPFSTQEDEKIMANYRKFANKWDGIASFLPGRTANTIKNHWHSVLRKVYLQQLLAAAAKRRLPDGDGPLVLFPLAPGDVKALGRDIMIPPVLHHPPPGVDLSGKSLKLFPLVPGDLVRRSPPRQGSTAPPLALPWQGAPPPSSVNDDVPLPAAATDPPARGCRPRAPMVSPAQGCRPRPKMRLAAITADEFVPVADMTMPRKALNDLNSCSEDLRKQVKGRNLLKNKSSLGALDLVARLAKGPENMEPLRELPFPDLCEVGARKRQCRQASMA